MEFAACMAIIVIILLLEEHFFKRMVFRNLGYRCEMSTEEAFEGDELFLTEVVENGKWLPIPWLKVEIHTSRYLHYAESSSTIAQENRHVTSKFVVKGHNKVTRKWKLRCLKRGNFYIDNNTLVAGGLLGVYKDSIPVHIGVRLLVYPQTICLDEFFAPVNNLSGDILVKRWINEDPFIISGAREYTPWDPMSKIDWKATARAGKLMVKKNDFTSDMSYTVILNVQSMENEYFDTVDKEAVEFGIKAAATVLEHAAKLGVPFQLVTNDRDSNDKSYGTITKQGVGRNHYMELLKALAKVEMKKAEDFEDFLDKVVPEIQNSQVILLTCYVNEKILDILSGLRKKNSCICILLLNDMDEQHVPTDIAMYSLRKDREII